MTGDDEGGTDDIPEDATDDAAGNASGRSRDPEWPVVASVVEYETPWYVGGYDLVEQPDGTEKRYYWAALQPAVVVVPVTGGEVVFVEQYRPVIRRTQLELPAGLVEDGETYTAAGARELREETGFDPAGIALLQEVHVATGVLRHRRGYVFAGGLEPVERALETNEFLSVVSVPVEDAVERAREGSTNDATVQGLLLAKEEGLL